jgi:AbrB family looped-hinge helix DNA binding protein
VSSKGQVVIPKSIRKKYGIVAETVVHWVEREDGVIMVPDSEDPVVAAKGMLKGSGLLDKWIQNKHVEKELEDRNVGGS